KVEGLGAVAGHVHLEPLTSQADREGVHEGPLVLQGEERLCGHGQPASDIDMATGPGPAGTWSVNVDPTPSADSTATVPPWLVATWRTMATPSPAPPGSRGPARPTQ